MADVETSKRRDPARHRAHAARWIAANPEKRRAHHAVRNAIRRGQLQRRPCEVCGDPGEAHHEDYSRPLDVTFLCRRHHAERHRIEGRVEGPRRPVSVRMAAEVHQ